MHTSSINIRRPSKEVFDFQDDRKDVVHDSRSYSHKSNRNQISRQGSSSTNRENDSTKQVSQQFQLRKSVSSKVIRMSTTQFQKRQQITTIGNQLSQYKNAYQLTNTLNSPQTNSKYFMTSRTNSYNSNQMQGIMSPLSVDQANSSNNKFKNQLLLSQAPMSLQFKKFQESYLISPLNGSSINKNSQMPELVVNLQKNNSNKNFNNSIVGSQKNSQSNLLQKYLQNSSQYHLINKQMSMNPKESTISQNEGDNLNYFANQSTDLNFRQNNPAQQKLSIITSKIYADSTQNNQSSQSYQTIQNYQSSDQGSQTDQKNQSNQNYQYGSSYLTNQHHQSSYNCQSPQFAATNSTAHTLFTTKQSFQSSPKNNGFFFTENPVEDFSLSRNAKFKQVQSINEDKAKEKINYTQNSGDQMKTMYSKKIDFTKNRGSAYYSTKSNLNSPQMQRKSLKDEFQEKDNYFGHIKMEKDTLNRKVKDGREKMSEMSYSEGEEDGNDSNSNEQNCWKESDKYSDYSIPCNKNSLLKSAKDQHYFKGIMSPVSSNSEIKQNRSSIEKPKLKFFEKLKKIDKIKEENEFDKVKIRNLDLETVVISHEISNNILPINLSRFYKENKIPQKIQNKLKESEKKNLESAQADENNINNGQGSEQTTENPDQLKSIERQGLLKRNATQQKANENEAIQKRVGGVNYQGLQDEEKIKEMEEYLESDKYNETFYANNRKMGKTYIDIVTDILKQKKARRSLKQVFIKNNRISNESLAKIVQNLPLSTKQLDISYNQINHIGSKYVTELLNDNAFHNLEYLNVSKNVIGDIGSIKIFEATVTNNFLKVLDLSHNRITNLSSKSISKVLSNNQYLDELYLGSNTLNNDSLKIICDGLGNNFNLKVLDLQNNSLGGSDNPQKFYGKRLIRILNDKHSSMKHLDLSYNRFLKAEALEIQKELQDNFYLYGLHFEGNPCNFIVNARGFLVQNKKSFEDQGRGMFQRNIRMNDFQNVSEIYKNNYYKNINSKNDHQILSLNPKVKQNPSQRKITNSCKSGEICWICDEYKEIKFTFKLNYKINREPIYIHLNFEEYQPFRMEQDPTDNTKFYIYRMCPPDLQVTYFFSNPFINQVSILPYNQIRSESNPMNGLSQRLKRPSMKANQIVKKRLYEDNNEIPILKTLVVDYTDIKNYVIPLPYLMNVYKLNNTNTNLKDKQFPFQQDANGYNLGNNNDFQNDTNNQNTYQNDVLESAESLIQQINQISERKKQEYQTHINKDEFEKNPEGEIVYVYQKKLCNILNDNYDPIIRSIIRQIQKPYLEQSGSAKGWKKNGWDVKNSVFAEYRGDDYLFLKNCFEFDWMQSKLNKMIRSEDDKENLKQVIYDIYPYLKNTYKSLASQNIYGEVFAVSSFLFSDFIQQSKIVDGKLMKLSDIDFNFIATNAQKEKNPRNPDRALIRFQFMEVLVRIAFDKYIKNKTFSNFSDAFKQILNEEDLLKLLMNTTDPQQWRESRLWTPQCDSLVKQKLDFFKKLYDKWAGSRNKEKKIFTNVKIMSCQEFKDLIVSYPVFADLLNEKEQNQVFNDSIMTQIDEVGKDKHMQMQLIEFVEAFGRVADKLSPVPYGEDKDAYTKQELIALPLHMKMESIIAQIDGNKGCLIQPRISSIPSMSALNPKDFSMPKINSKNVLDQKSVAEIKDTEEIRIPSQIKLGFKGFMLAKSLKKRLIGNNLNLQKLNGNSSNLVQNKSLEIIDGDIL